MIWLFELKSFLHTARVRYPDSLGYFAFQLDWTVRLIKRHPKQWEFYHPHFRADTLSDLDNIKRKIPVTRQKTSEVSPSGEGPSTNSTDRAEDLAKQLTALQRETTSALNLLNTQCTTLQKKLDQAYDRLDFQQRQIDLLTQAHHQYQPFPPLELITPSVQDSLDQKDRTNNSTQTTHQLATKLDHSPTSSFSTNPSQYLSVANPNPASIPIPSPVIKTGRWPSSPSVLIVEDDQVCRKISSTILELMGCRIEFACDGLNAVSRMKHHAAVNDPFDIVLMDILMPNMDGLIATSLIRKFDLKTPIISMTSNFEPVDVIKYIDIGMDDCLAKPFTKEGMIVMLQKHLFNPSRRVKLITGNGSNAGNVMSIDQEAHPHPSRKDNQSSTHSPPESPQCSDVKPSYPQLSSSFSLLPPYLVDFNKPSIRGSSCYPLAQPLADLDHTRFQPAVGEENLDRTSTQIDFDLIDPHHHPPPPAPATITTSLHHHYHPSHLQSHLTSNFDCRDSLPADQNSHPFKRFKTWETGFFFDRFAILSIPLSSSFDSIIYRKLAHSVFYLRAGD